MEATLTRAEDGKHKFKVVISDGEKKKTLRFGDINYQDFTQHHDEARRRSYISRHSKRENHDDLLLKVFGVVSYFGRNPPSKKLKDI